MGAQLFQSVVPEIKISTVAKREWLDLRFHRYRLHCCPELCKLLVGSQGAACLKCKGQEVKPK